MEVKGLCKDCAFLRQETSVEDEGGQRVTVVDTFCGLFDVFVPLDGFCHAFEVRVGATCASEAG